MSVTEWYVWVAVAFVSLGYVLGSLWPLDLLRIRALDPVEPWRLAVGQALQADLHLISGLTDQLRAAASDTIALATLRAQARAIVSAARRSGDGVPETLRQAIDQLEVEGRP